MDKNNLTDDSNPKWDDYVKNEVQNFSEELKIELESIFNKTISYSKESREWYWSSIKDKKRAAISIRTITFILLILGAVCPILAGFDSDTKTSLAFTQSGVALLAAAGLLHSADKVFGWSSGWLRYVSTVTEMEALTLNFRLDWAAYIIAIGKENKSFIKKDLFVITQKLSKEIEGLRSQETEKWVTEYNQNTALLGDLIKSQRQSAEKAEEAAKIVLKAKDEEIRKKQEEEQRILELGSSGHLEVKINHSKTPVPISIKIDAKEEVKDFFGASWIKKDMEAGNYVISISYGNPKQEAQQLAKIKPSEVCSIDFMV